MAYYDIGEVFQRIEEEMIASMSRNLKRHLSTEHAEGLNYSMWQAEQLAALNNYRKNNQKKFSKYFSTINSQIDDVLRKAYATGEMDQEIRILEAIKKGFKIYDRSAEKTLRGNFFKINERKLNALIEATQKDMATAETAMLRRADDEYRKILFNAEAYYNTGVGTLPQAVDMATKDFLSRGISCIEYANGAMVGIDTYARMAIRTAQTRAYLQGESVKRDEWGINTVIVNKRGVACPRCLRYTGKVFYDDVWGHSPVPSPAKYPKLSTAIAGGLYHPNCKDIHTTYFEGVSAPPEPMTQEEKDEANRVYALEQRQRYNERQIRKYKRLHAGSTDPENAQKYGDKLKYWQNEQKKHIEANGDVLRSRPELEKVFQMPDDFMGGNGGSAEAVSGLKANTSTMESGLLSSGIKRIGTNDVDLDQIKSPAFRKKFSNLTDNSAVNEALRKYADAILTHRKGSDVEDLYIINAETGELLYRNITGSEKLGVTVPDDVIERLRKEYGGKIIAIHNHPTNIPPTGSDYSTAGYRRYQFGVVVTHDGKVYTYRAGNKPFYHELLDKRVDKYTEPPYNLDIQKAHEKALNEFVEEYGISWKDWK